MAIFASTTLGSSDPSKAMSIKALEARAQALSAAQSKQELPTSLPSPWQGASLVMNQAADAIATKRADQAAAQQRQELAALQSQIGPEGPNPQQLAGVNMRDPELGRMYAQEAFQARQSAAATQAAKEAAVAKAEQDKAYLAEQDRLGQAHPQTDVGKVKADLAAGRVSQEEADAAIKKLNQGSPADQAAMATARDENINLQTTQAKLAEAEALLQSGKVYSGAGAGLKADYGQVAGKLHLGGVTGTDPESTAATKRFNQIMSSEVVAQLKAIKGPASNKDMEWATSTVNDPSAPIENKIKAMQVLRAQMDAHLKSSGETLKGMGTAPVKVEIPAAGGATAAPAAGPQSVASEAEALALPPGTKFKLPDGRTGTAR